MIKSCAWVGAGLLLLAVASGCATPTATTASPPPPAGTENPSQQPAAPDAPATPPAAPQTPDAPDTDEAAEAPPLGAFSGCAATLDEAPARAVTVAGKKATAAGYRLRFDEPDPDGQLVLGVLGPINEASGLNILALRKYLAFFAEQKVDAILVPGDVGEVAPGIAHVLTELAQAKLPVLVVTGNRECKEDFADGVAEAQKSSDAIVNLNAFRAVELGGLTLVSLPGYYNIEFLSCETGCHYDRRTLEDVVKLAKAAKGPVLLVSHGPPRGASSQSLDFAVNGGNAGDPEVARIIRDGHIQFGVFSNIKEAGARATAADTLTQIPEGKEAKALFLNPGPADTTKLVMNDGSTSYGFAATLTFKQGAASWKLYRAPKPTPEEKKAAKALEPAARAKRPAK